MSIDPDSGATVPEDAVSPFPNPGEVAQDYDAQAMSRLATQYRQATKFRALLSLLVSALQDMEDVAVTIPAMDAPATATGVNLDVTGDLVGQSRVLPNGTEVVDAFYRTLIALRIARNATIGSSPQLIAALTVIFGATPFRYYDIGHMYVGIELASGEAPDADTVALLDRDRSPIPVAMGVAFGRGWYDPDNVFAFFEDPEGSGFGEIGDPDQGGQFAEIF